MSERKKCIACDRVLDLKEFKTTVRASRIMQSCLDCRNKGVRVRAGHRDTRESPYRALTYEQFKQLGTNYEEMKQFLSPVTKRLCQPLRFNSSIDNI